MRYRLSKEIKMDWDNNDGTAFGCTVQAGIGLDDDGDRTALITAQDFADTRADVPWIPAVPQFTRDTKVQSTTSIQTSVLADGRASKGTIRKVVIVITTAIVLSPLPSAATPCTPGIDRGWAHVNLKIQARIGAGRSAPQSSIALLHRQPTPSSVAAAQGLLNDVWLPIEAAVSALSRARQADLDNDERACRQALIEVQRAIDP
jgi:hypothetical protein